MNAFQGMDTAEVTDLAGRFTERAETLSTMLETLSSQVGALVGTEWIGPDADGFAAAFDSSVRPQLTTAAESLRTRGGDLEGHVDEQNGASDPAGGGAGGPGGGGPGGGSSSAQSSSFLGADWGDVSFGEFWQNLTENIGIDGVDSAGLIISSTHSFAKNFGEFALGKGSVPAFIPVIGDVFTGVMAGIDRWNDDAGRSDLSTGERIGRAVLDGAVNFGGSMAGSAIGGSIGTSIGTSIGGLFGGGGGAAAGAPAGGVGAVPGAAVGGGGGAAAGGVIGGIVGDVMGSYVGATLADSVIDTFLD